MGVQQQPTLVNKPKTKPISEARKIRKPLMERKRRERINTCLNDLASLLIDAKMVKTEPGKPAKLEKADILELTVKHIKTLKTQEKINTASEVEEDKPASSYKEGFTKCMGMVDQTLGKAGKEALRQRLLAHLKVCLQSLDPPTQESIEPTTVTPATTEEAESRLSSPETNIVSNDTKSENETDIKADSQVTETATKEPTTRITLVPTRLPSGGVAFVIQGGIEFDPSLLLPQMESKDIKPIASENVSPPPPSPPTTCDSSTSSPPTTTSSTPSVCTPAPSPTPSSSSPPPVICSSTTPTPIMCSLIATSTQCPATPPPPTSSQNSTFTSLTSLCPSTRTSISHHPITQPHATTSVPPTILPEIHCPSTVREIPPTTLPEFHCPSTVPFTPTMYSSPSRPLPTYCVPPASNNQIAPTSTHILQLPGTSTYPIHNVAAQPQPILHYSALPQHSSYNPPPTPPPSISPQTVHPLHQYQNFQTMSSEEDMDTDGLSEEEIDIDVENDVPFDLSMRRIWRYW